MPTRAPTLAAQLEALLFINSDAVAAERLAAAVGEPLDTVLATLLLMEHNGLLGGGGIVVRRQAEGWRLTTAPSCAAVLERFAVDAHSFRLSIAALETLAVVAYQQPVSRGRVAAVRGVAVDGVMRTLLARGLIREHSRADNGASLYETTALFLDKLGLQALTELPSLAPLLPDVETMTDSVPGPGSTSAPVGALPRSPMVELSSRTPASKSSDHSYDAGASSDNSFRVEGNPGGSTGVDGSPDGLFVAEVDPDGPFVERRGDNGG